MKFTDGQWLIQEGVQIHNPVEVYDSEKSEQGVTIYAPCHAIERRGNVLMGPMLTMTFTSPLENVIKVTMCHFKGKKNNNPAFEVADRHVVPTITEADDEVVLSSGKLKATIQKDDYAVSFAYDGEILTKSTAKSAGYITTDNHNAYMKEELSLGVGECVYGLGERFTSFVKNGQTVEIWNKDGGTSSEQAYKNIPFYLTNKGYGVFVNHPENVSFEVASEKVSKVQFSVLGEYLEYYMIGGDNLKEVLANYTALTGKPALPPAWSFGLWLSTSFTTDYDEKTVSEFINGMAERQLPLHVFHFDCFWMKAFQWCDFAWDEAVFPDPQSMLARLKDRGLKICVWINPYIGQKSKLFAEGMKYGYLLKKQNGDVWQWDLWQPGLAVVDFTNPEACQWFVSKLERLMDMGVDCFKTDFGERIPTDVVYYDKSDAIKMHNYYTYLYNKTVFTAVERRFGKNNAMVFARSATAGGQQFPVHWGGDCNSNYESMAESLRGGLSLSLSGFGFWSHDIGGFENTAPPDVYKRWVAFGLLSSHSRLHGESSYRVPWLFDQEAVDVLRFFTHLKCRLMPYLFSAACQAAAVGIPVMRAMVLEFTHDRGCDYLDKQYMLGESLLVAPVFDQSGYLSYYLPSGRWTHFITGKVVEGGKWFTEYYDFMNLPLMVRPNSIIAVGREEERPDYDFASDVSLHVFELAEDITASALVYNQSGKLELEVTITRSDRQISIYAKGAGKPWSVILRGVHEVTQIQDASWEQNKLGIRIIPARFTGTIIMEL